MFWHETLFYHILGCPLPTEFCEAAAYNMNMRGGGTAVTVVYVDSVFVLNTLMDYLILSAAAGLAGLHKGRLRWLLAALFGGSYAVAVFLPGCSFLAEWQWKVAAGLLIAAVAFAGQRHFIRIALLALAVSCGLAGCVLALGMLSGGVPMENGVFYTNLDAKVLLIAASAAYLTLSVVFRAGARHHVSGTRIKVKIVCGKKSALLTALCDTGNALLDPSTNRPVLVVNAASLKNFWPQYLQHFLRPEILQNPAEVLGLLNEFSSTIRFHLIPFRSVGVSGGLLLAFRSDWTEIGEKYYPHLLIALSPTEVGETFDALWGGGEGEQNGEAVDLDQAVAAKDRNFTGIPGSLHWRKRYPAAAPAAGQGGRTPGKTGRSGSAENSD